MQDPVTPTGETADQSNLGTTSEETPPTTGSETPTPPEETVSKAAFETLRQEKDKIAQERNLLRNQARTAEVEALEKSGQIEQANTALKAELADIKRQQEEEQTQREARQFRTEVLKEYPNAKVREAAEKLIAKNPSNLVWSDGASQEQAKRELTEQLDSLAEVLGTPDAQADTGSQGTVHPNNPAASVQGKTTEELLKLDSKELAKLLPHAEARY